MPHLFVCVIDSWTRLTWIGGTASSHPCSDPQHFRSPFERSPHPQPPLPRSAKTNRRGSTLSSPESPVASVPEPPAADPDSDGTSGPSVGELGSLQART